MCGGGRGNPVPAGTERHPPVACPPHGTGETRYTERVRAVVFAGGEVHVESRADPVPGRGQLLVRVRAAGLNGADLIQLRGGYPAPPGVPPDIPGLELAGEVVERGEGASRYALGDRVMSLAGGAGQAELAVVDERIALPVPGAFDWLQAGGFPEAFITAHDALITQCGLHAGDRLLVTGAAGGVGTAAVQLGVALGAQVVGSVRAASLHPAVAALGARVIEPAAVADGGPYDVVLELVGSASLVTALPALAPGARVSVIGVGGGSRLELDLLALMGRRARIMGSTLRSRSADEKAQAVQRVRDDLWPLLEQGRLRVVVGHNYGLEEAAAAYARFRAGANLGKIVLRTG